MKQNILLTLLLILFFKSYSQEKNIDFQLSVGTTLSFPKTSKLTDLDIDGGPEIKSSTNIGTFVLPGLNYSLNEKTSIDFGLGFYLDRFSIEDKTGAVTNKGNRNISQLQTPLNVNFHFGKNNVYQLGVGGFSSFLISAKEKGESTIDLSQIDVIDPNDNFFQNSNESYNNDLKDYYNSVAFGAFIQLKKEISFSKNTNGFIVIKINQYFNSVKNSDSDLNSHIDFKNEKEPTSINLGIGIEL